MKIVLLILATIWAFGYTMNHIAFNMKYNPLMSGNNAQKIIGSILAAIFNGAAWWYIINWTIEL